MAGEAENLLETKRKQNPSFDDLTADPIQFLLHAFKSHNRIAN